MAARYWIGGTGNWNDTAHWSASSGGTGGATVPTSADNVTFDSNSGTGTITVNAVANMLDLNFTGINTITLANAAYNFNVYGSLTLHSNLTTSFTGTGYLYLKATDSRNITTNGKVASWNRLCFDGNSGTWTNMDDCNVGNTKIILANGNWQTNNFTITTTNNYDTGVGVKTLTLGSSLFFTTSFYNTYPVGYTFKYNTSTIILGSFSEITGNNTFYNLKHIVSGVSGRGMMLYGNQNVQNNLTISGANSEIYRFLILSNVIGTPRTLTVNGSIAASNVDFRDITLAGTANRDLSAIQGGSGDCCGNSGIIFTPSQTQYFKHTSGAVNWSDATKWFSDYTRTVAGRVPLPQDDAVFDAYSFTGASTLNVNVSRIGRSLDMSFVNEEVTMKLVNAIECYGSYVLGNSITQTGNYYVYFFGRNNCVVNIYDKLVYSLVFNAYNGFYTLLSNAICNIVFASYYGTLDINDHNVKALVVHLDGETTYLGNGIIEGTSNSGYAINVAKNIVAEGSTLLLTAQSGTNLVRLAGAGTTLNKVRFSGNHTGGYKFDAGISVGEVIIDAGRKVQFISDTVKNINKITAIGTPSQPIIIESTTPGQRHTINYTGSEASTVEYCSISDSKVNEARRLLAKNSVNAGNNQNWGFDTLPPLALNKKQVDKMYWGDKQVLAAYKGSNKIF